jgi:S-DNA-T family DNA segregation ATPase FtsK/SpoIIIE
MFRRYKLMEQIGVRNFDGYNSKAPDNPMPYLVIVIDELADLMMAAAYEVEQSLVRLAQLGRATGIHIIVATQRPSVNVVTGLLKANVPGRIAFAVASQVDSRVILDGVGAEKLLGKGDMLLLTSSSPKPRRVQGTFVHDREIEELVEFWSTQQGPPVPEIPMDDEPVDSPMSEKSGSEEDDLLERARQLAGRYHHISPSVLQRRLQVGYPVAMELMEQLEEEGLVSPPSEAPSRSGR